MVAFSLYEEKIRMVEDEKEPEMLRRVTEESGSD